MSELNSGASYIILPSFSHHRPMGTILLMHQGASRVDTIETRAPRWAQFSDDFHPTIHNGAPSMKTLTPNAV